MNITPKQIKSQYDRVKRDGWLKWFEDAARLQGTTTALFLAIGSRETNLRNIKGDYRNGKYNGFGVMQVDVGTDPEYAKNWTPDAVEPSIRRGAEIWDSKFVQVMNGQGKRLKVRSKAFTGREVESDDARRIATAAYNCGLWAYYHFSNHAHIDLTTTGKDYSRDVYDRALVFAELLEADGEEGAYAREVELQGKYATADEKAKVKKPLVTKPVTENPTPQPEPEIKTQEPEPPAAEQAPKPTVTPVEAPPTSITTKIAATAGAIGPVVAATGLKIGGVEFKTGGLIAFAAVVIVGMVVAAWIWNQSQERRERRQRLSMENLASDTKSNVIAAGSKV